MAVGGYAGCRAFLLTLGFLRDCDSRSSGLAMLAIMPVATWYSGPLHRVWRDPRAPG